MATCNPQTLLDSDPCLSALNPMDLEIVETQLICALYNNLDSGAEISCDIQTLLDDGKCLPRDSFQLRVIRAQLLCEIAALL